jgi:hypothetical protein
LPAKSARILEKEGNRMRHYKMIQTEFGEGVVFNYAKATRLAINAFGLEEKGKERSVKDSASIDAARVTKNLFHTSAGFKMTDSQGWDPLKFVWSFLADEHSLHDLQSRTQFFYSRLV